MAPELTLFGAHNSSCTARVRLALTIKDILFKYVPVNIDPGTDEQHSVEYSELNPSRTVPTLVVAGLSPSPLRITQSGAAIEYLEEAFPDTSPVLLPRGSDTAAVGSRALVRSLCAIVVADTQPVSNTTVLGWIEGLGGRKDKWAHDVHVRGLKAFEGVLHDSGCDGRFCVGGQVGLADVCLVPMVWNALKAGVDLAQFPTVKRVYEHLSELEAFQKVWRWRNQLE